MDTNEVEPGEEGKVGGEKEEEEEEEVEEEMEEEEEEEEEWAGRLGSGGGAGW